MIDESFRARVRRSTRWLPRPAKELEEKATGEVQKIDSLESQPITPHIHELLYETRGELRNSIDEMQSVLAKMREFLNHPSE
jgi:hypothetical protein